jgi:hypothetical protein
MKKSNKILIAFAASLLLIPLLGMLIVSATMYKKREHTITDVVENKTKDNFKTTTPGMVSRTIGKSFTAVQIADAKRMGIVVHLVKDEQYGFKIDKQSEKLIHTNVDAQGILQISFNVDELQKNNTQNYTNLFIYSPRLTKFEIENADLLELVPAADSLQLNLNRVGSFYFGNGVQMDQLNLNAKQVEDLVLRRDAIKAIDVNLIDTKFKIESMSLANAKIVADGDCSIAIYNRDESKKQTIAQLFLETKGKATVDIDEVTINNCSGRFSDQTSVKMPAVNINQMYNAK